ncbi:MAG TPA: hypothetical protein VG826_30455 [Pirellulales bacterium]|nr:hypothetical protein [Pirellulales bacterium]
MATVEKAVLRGESRILLSGVSWELYEQLRENEDNWHVTWTAPDRGGRRPLCSELSRVLLLQGSR